ncbi:MAG: putative Zn-dependent protease [Mariniblastus sp.]|jgi:predicted Zn-dependent protease
MSRREQLESMLADTPGDTFLRYALAMEWANEDEHEKSLTMHRELMNDTPQYVPSFFMSGQLLAELERIDEAQSVLQAGIAQADTQGNTHAAGEMRQFLDTLD